MRILYVTMQYGRGYSQGTERYLTILSNGLATHGCEAVFLAADPEKREHAADAALIQSDPEIYNCPTSGWMTVLGWDPAELRDFISRLRPDLVHVANPGWVGIGVIDAARSLGIPVVLTMMDYWWICPKHTLHHPLRGQCAGRMPWRDCAACVAIGRSGEPRSAVARLPLAGRWLAGAATVASWRRKGVPHSEIDAWQRRNEVLPPAMNAASAVIFASQTARRLIAEELRGPAKYTIPYGLEPRWFDTTADARPARSAGGPADRLIIGFAGALAPHKGPHVLLEALHRLGWRETKLRIAGGGDDVGYVDRLKRLGRELNIEWVGRVPSEAMPEFHRSLDLLIVPSLWPENLPIVVLEAAAVGTPTLASRVGGIAEAIPDESRLFAVDSVSALADCLDRWRCAPSGAPIARPSTAARMCEATVNVYREVLSKGSVA